MLSDLFWDAATSTIVLSLIAAIALAAFVVAHVPGIVRRFWPAVDGYARAAALVQVVAWSLLFFLVGFRISDERAETKRLKDDLAFTKLQIENANETAQDAERLKAEAEAKANEAKGLLDDFRKSIKPDAGADCSWSVDEFGRLRDLGRSKRR